jgi:hypothetical protein
VDGIELVEIRVGPNTITEVYAQRLGEEAVTWEESLRERTQRARRRAVWGLLAALAMGATAIAGLVWLLRGL